MSSYDDYVALARQLSERRRAGERDAAADTDRRRSLLAAADQLDHRLAAQAQHLDQLGRAFGVPPPPHPSAAPGGPAPSTVPPVSGPGGPPGPVAPVPGHGAGTGAPGWGAGGGPGPGSGPDGGAAAASGWPGGEAYPQVTVGPADRALPVAVGPGVPAQRTAALDPAGELEVARRLADDADRHAQQAERYAHQPVLLPGWTPLARALAVYTGCAAVGVLMMLGLVLGNGIGLVDGFTLGAWMCAGLPALSFFGGYLILGRWGKPVLVAGTPPRYVHVGFLVCFLLVPIAYCAYLVLIRTFR
ncbi:hypothetical protein [Micromonospora fluostatini]|uniref:hypothetical protein n=1 Tax=Micromonospora sp. JCM 30529 TaxID=3421643 RepID=UPI003D16D7C2